MHALALLAETLGLALGWVLLMVCTGLGFWLIARPMGRYEVDAGWGRVPLLFWVGAVWWGWSVFFPAVGGFLTPLGVAPLALPALAGLLALPRQLKGLTWRVEKPSAPVVLWGAIGLLAMILALAGACVPPTEGDTLAYHFALPKLYAMAHGLVYQPTAVTFASPQFSHMVSTLAYVAGGERLMVAQAFAATVMAAWAGVVLARRFVAIPEALVVGVLLLTAPVVTYAFSAGTVELRLMGSLSAGVVFLLAYLEAPRARVGALVLASALMGAVVGGKFFSLFLLPPLAFVLLVGLWGQPWRLMLGHITLAGAVVALVGLPWYALLWKVYGSPVFPQFAVMLGSPFWSDAQQAAMMKLYITGEKMVPRDLWHFVAYPWVGTFEGVRLDSDRTGVGPLLALSLYGSALLAAIAAFVPSLREVFRKNGLWVLPLLFLGFYMIFFFVGVSGRVRHLLPVFPLMLVAGATLWEAAKPSGRARVGFHLICMMIAGAQLGMVALLNLPAWKVVVGRLDAGDYVRTYASARVAADLVRAHVGPGDRLLVTELRTLNYELEPAFQAYVETQQEIPLATGTPATLWEAIRRHGFTHWLTVENPLDPARDTPQNGHALFRPLVLAGCFEDIGQLGDVFRPSRAAPTFKPLPRTYHLFKVTACGYKP